MKLTKKFKLESSELNEALIYMEQEIAKCGLLKVSRSTYANKELFKSEFLEFLNSNKYIARDKHNSNRYLFHNSETDTYEQVSINISKCKTIVQEVVQAEMIENRKVSKKEIKD